MSQWNISPIFASQLSISAAFFPEIEGSRQRTAHQIKDDPAQFGIICKVLHPPLHNPGKPDMDIYIDREGHLNN